MLLLATKSCPQLMVDRYRGLKINTRKRNKLAPDLLFSWNTAYVIKIHKALIPTGNWAVLGFRKLREYFYFRMSYCYSYKARVHPDFFPIKKRKKMEWKYQSIWEKMEHLYTEKTWLASIPCSYRHEALVDARPGRLCWILQDNLVSARKIALSHVFSDA